MASGRTSGGMGKSMYRYAWHARSDAIALARLLADLYDVESVEAVYERMRLDAKVELESVWREQLAEFIEMSESRRPAYIRKTFDAKSANGNAVPVFLVLAVVGASRAARMFGLRDSHMRAFSPGGGYRVSTASMLDFAYGASEITNDFSWPEEFVNLARDAAY